MKALSMIEFITISATLRKHLLEGRRVKYVDIVLDNRSGEIFTVTFRHWLKEETVFSVVNRGDNPKFVSLYDEIMDWLDS